MPSSTANFDPICEMSSDPGTAASAKIKSGSPTRSPTWVSDMCNWSCTSGITGGMARMVMRMAPPASHSRPIVLRTVGSSSMGLRRRPNERPSRLAAESMEEKPGVANHGAPAHGSAQEKPRALGITAVAGRLRMAGNKDRTGRLRAVMSDLAAAEQTLRTTFSFGTFRPGQADIVDAILDGRDVLAVMPTGSGKSLCYQPPALLRGGLTVVVSPLIALMRNQVAQLLGYGIATAALNSANDPAENRAAIEGITGGELRLIYVAPERLVRKDTLDLLKRGKVTLLAVDEAHCISQWGHDFRPEYAALGAVQSELANVQTVAFTAAADAATRTDILSKLFPRPPAVFVHGFDRPNLRLAMAAKNGGRKQIADFIAAHRGQSGIVYCSSRRKTEELAEFLRQNGVKALPYHAGMEPQARSHNQDVFLQDDGVVVAATVAFGMGIDKPDVRFVLHADMPANIETYYQEIGRAGRDGLPADTLTLYGMGDIRLRRMQIDESEAAAEQKRVERQRLNALVALCESPRCRRQTLLAYFGETAQPCGNCDFCCEGAEVIDGTIAAQKALSAILRTGERFGTEHLTNVLLGGETEANQKICHERLPPLGG